MEARKIRPVAGGECISYGMSPCPKEATHRGTVGRARGARLAWAFTMGLAGLVGCSNEMKSPGAGAGAAGGSSGAAGSSGVGTGGSSGDAGSSTGGTGGGATGGTGATGANGTCEFIGDIPARIWRLSARQYGNAVRDALGASQGPVLTSLGGENPIAFYTDDALTVDYSMLNNMYQLLGPALDEAAPRVPAMTACQGGEAPAACARRFAESFGKKAFRRPLEAAEVDALLATYTVGSAQSFETGIRLMMEALLLSPSFVFRTELGTGGPMVTLTPHEVASQLSFLLASTIPDASLVAAADSNTLATPQGTAAEVDRLLALPEVRANVTRIVNDWFNVRGIPEGSHADMYLAGLPPPATGDIQSAVESDLVRSAELFIDDVLWGGTGDLNQLLNSPKIFVNQRLATLYELPFSGATADTFVPVDAPAGQRAGMLTQPSMIWMVSGTQTTSIVHRGLHILHEIVCGMPPGDPGAILSRPDIIEALSMLPTEMAKARFRQETGECVGCHIAFDGYGIALQGFDPIGRHQTMVEGEPVDDTTAIETDYFSGTFKGPIELADRLIATKQFLGCAEAKISTYALGRRLDSKGRVCELNDLVPAIESGGNTASALFRAISNAPFMRQRTGGAQ